jgi:hypothetical protein
VLHPPGKFNFDINVVEIGLALLAGALAWGQFTVKFDQHGQALERLERQGNRIEHYLENSDTDYWKRVTENGDTR